MASLPSQGCRNDDLIWLAGPDQFSLGMWDPSGQHLLSGPRLGLLLFFWVERTATFQRGLLPSRGTSLPGCHLLLLLEAHQPAMEKGGRWVRAGWWEKSGEEEGWAVGPG